MVNRRLFLRIGVIAGAGASAAAIGAFGPFQRLLGRFFPRRLPAPVLAFLESIGAGGKAGRLVSLRSDERSDLIGATTALLTAAAQAGRPLDTALRARIEDDFMAGRLVVADGWDLAETEAGVYLILADIDRGLYRAS